MEETILTAKDLKFRYDPEQPDYALNGVSAEVKRGEFVAVLGANGCGKSTLAKHFNAILLPESGTVLVEGMDTKDEDKIYDIRQTVGMVFQSPDNQIVATVVEEDVAFALENLGVPPEEMRRRVDEAMKMAGIYEYRERAPHNLSGGQKQRVAIAGVVAMRPDCLILDEATAMLDPRGREQVMQTIHHLNKNMGITVVSITHYMEARAMWSWRAPRKKCSARPKRCAPCGWMCRRLPSCGMSWSRPASPCPRASSTPARAHRLCMSF